MVAQGAPVDPEQKNKGIATTTAEAKATKAPFLCLSSTKLTQLPEGLDKLNNLTNLDISNNNITSIPENSLPKSLVELTLTGCQLTELPASLGSLTRLKKLFAGANKLQQVDPVFRCPALQHAGLAYNQVARLPPESTLAASGLLSLDLSHNDLEGLAATLTQLASLPSLSALSLGGNPLALSPRYLMETRGRLKQLLYLDGQRQDLPANSRPGTANSLTGSSSRHLQQQTSQRHLASAQAGALTGPSLAYSLRRCLAASLLPHATVRFDEAGCGGGGDYTAVTLTLRGLRPAEDPFGWLTARWDEAISTALDLGTTTPPTLEVPVPPLQPVIYHVEMTDVEGTPLACIPIKLSPPTPPDVAVMFDPKAKAAAAAAAAKEAKKATKPATPSKTKRGKAAAAPPPEPGAQRPLETGLLSVTLPIRGVVAHRNWLRSGIMVTMYETTLTAVPRPPTAPEPTEGKASSAKTGGAPRKKKTDEPPPVEYDITTRTDAIGTALLRAGSLVVDGYTFEATERLDFVPAARLFDDKGIRMPLKDPRHPTKPVGHMDVVVELHVRPSGTLTGGEG